MDIIYRVLSQYELRQIYGINRSEVFVEKYMWEKGRIMLVPDHQAVDSFTQEEIRDIVSRQVTLLKEGEK